MLYHPKNYGMWDAWAIERQGEYHLFHLLAGAPPSGWGHAVSRDLLHWQEQPPVLTPSGKNGDIQYRFTGCTVEHDGIYYTYFTMRDEAGDQRIGLATSKDLYQWTDHPGNPVLTPDPALFLTERPTDIPWLNIDCRDMLVIPAPEGGFYGYFAAVEAAPEHHGVIGVAYSQDLIHWENQSIAYRTRGAGVVEMPEVFEWNGRYVLTMLSGSNYGMRYSCCDPRVTRSTIYAMADHPRGPFVQDPRADRWIGGPEDTGYSSRTVMAEGQRRVFYVCPNHGDSVLSLPKTVGCDAFGRPAVVYADDLMAKLRHASLDATPTHHVPTAFAWAVYGGDWEKTDTGVKGSAQPNSWQAALIAPPEGGLRNFEIRGHFEGNASAVGFVVYETETDGTPKPPFFNSGRRFAVLADAEKQCVSVATPYDWIERGAASTVLPQEGFDFCLVKVDHVLEVYVNDVLVLNLGADLPEHCVPGYFVDDGQVLVTNVEIWQIED